MRNSFAQRNISSLIHNNRMKPACEQQPCSSLWVLLCWVPFLPKQSALMLQRLTGGFALRLCYTPSNCISTRRYIELVKIHKTTPLQGSVCVIYFHRQYPCVVILACVKPIKTQRRHPFFLFFLSSSLSLHTNSQIFYLKVGHFFFVVVAAVMNHSWGWASENLLLQISVYCQRFSVDVR